MSGCILQWIRALCQVDNWTPGFYGLICWDGVERWEGERGILCIQQQLKVMFVPEHPR